MKLIFDENALDDLQGIFAWIAKDDVAAATKVVREIFEKTERLLIPELTRMGRPGREAGTHELIDGPYVIVYEVHERRGEVVVLAVVHGRRDRG
jgi:toxin ParE1/3/4